MSTDQQDRSRPPAPDEGPARHEPPKSSLSIAQVIGGALAAMTAAALGSRLSLAGTVVGAAVASVIAAVAGAIYTASLRRTSKHVSAVLTRVRPTATGGTSAPAQDPTAANPTVVGTPDSSVTDTTIDPATGWALPPEPNAQATDAAAGGRSRISWKPVVVTAVLMFVLAALALTGLELATGRALSGGTGTTVGQVAEPDTRPSARPTASASATPSARPTASPTASTSSSPRPGATSSSTPSNEPTARPSTSTTPTPTPAPTLGDTAAPSPTPTAPGAPSGATPTS